MMESLRDWIHQNWSSWGISPAAGQLSFLHANRPRDPEVFDLLVFDGSPQPRVHLTVAIGSRRLDSRSLRGLQTLAASQSRGPDHDLVAAAAHGEVTLIIEEAGARPNLPQESHEVALTSADLPSVMDWLARIHHDVPADGGFLQICSLPQWPPARTPRGWRIRDWSRFGGLIDPCRDCLDLLSLVRGGEETETERQEILARHLALLGIELPAAGARAASQPPSAQGGA